MRSLPLDARVGSLPVAQRQIVAICRGLAANARLLFMDEPTASLTRHEVDLLLATVRRLKAQGVAIVFVSHRLEEVVEIAERVTVLRDGRKVGTFPAAEIDDHRLAELMTGESLEHTLSAAGRRRPNGAVLEVRGASRAGEFEDVSLRHPRGRDPRPDRPARRWPHRAGAGAVRHDAARQRRDRRRRHAPGVIARTRTAIAAGIAYVSEDRLSLGVNLRQSIADNIAITVLDRLAQSPRPRPVRATGVAGALAGSSG